MAGLMDFLQSASNTAASNVSAPVDGLAWLLRKMGADVPSNPVMGSEWMQERGLTRPMEQSGYSLAGETAGLLSPMLAAAKAPQIAQGLLQMGDNAAIPQTLNKEAGMVRFENWGKRNPPPAYATTALPSHPELKSAVNPAIARLNNFPDVSIGMLPNNEFLAKNVPLWGSKQKPFYAIGDDLNEIIAATKSRISNADRGLKGTETNKKNTTLIGRLQQQYGDIFDVKKSERSSSEYITHKPSGTKIRISDHDLPLGYGSPDLNLNANASLDDKLKAIANYLE